MKKYVLAIALFSCSTAHAIGLGVELVTHTAQGNTGSGGALATPAVNSLGATACFVGATYNNPSLPAISDDYNNIYTSTGVTINTGSNQITAIYFSSTTTGGGNLATGPNHVFYANITGGTNIFGSIEVECFAGVLYSSSPFDKTTATENNSSLTLAPPAFTPTNNSALVITVVGTQSASLPYSITAGWTITDSEEFNANNFSSAMAYQIQTTAASAAPTWTKSGTAAQMTASMASFNATAFITNIPRTIIIK